TFGEILSGNRGCHCRKCYRLIDIGRPSSRERGKWHRRRPGCRMDLAKNLPVQGDSGYVVGRPGRDVRAGLPKAAAGFPYVLKDNDSREGRPTDGMEHLVKPPQRDIPASMRFMPVLGTVIVPLRKLPVGNLAGVAPFPTGNGRKHGVQVIKVDIVHVALCGWT